MAFDRFANRKQRETPKSPSVTEPFIVSVNPYVSLKRSLDLMARISSAQLSRQVNKNIRELNDIFESHGFEEFMDNHRKVLLNTDLMRDLHNELFSLMTALDNESFGNKKRVKAVVAGYFNAGKSAFLNHVVGKKILPEDMVPATAVPAFMFCQKELPHIRVFGENKSGALLGLDENILSHISHSTESTTAIQIATALERFIVEMPHNDYQNLVFIDTPGFGNKNSNEAESTDDKVASYHASNADMIIYLIPSKSGGIREADWEKINKFDDKPVILVLTKNDEHPPMAAQKVFSDTVEAVRGKSNIVEVISMSSYVPDFFLSRSGLGLNTVLHRTAQAASRGTEIDRIWNNISVLLNDEIEASNKALEDIKKIFKEKKSDQNEINKEMHSISDFLSKRNAQIQETLIDDINKGIKSRDVTFNTLIDFYKRVDGIEDNLISYHNGRVFGNETLESIIKDFRRCMSYYSDRIKNAIDMDWGYYDEEGRKAFVEYIDHLTEDKETSMKEQYDSICEEVKGLQERMKIEEKIIQFFTSLHFSLSSWKNRKVQELKPVPYVPQTSVNVPDIFQAIAEMDEEMLIDSLSKPTDLTTMYNSEGFSAITFAAACGNISALRFMFKLKAKGKKITPKDRDKNNRTMVDAAMAANQNKTVEFINNHFSKS